MSSLGLLKMVLVLFFGLAFVLYCLFLCLVLFVRSLLCLHFLFRFFFVNGFVLFVTSFWAVFALVYSFFSLYSFVWFCHCFFVFVLFHLVWFCFFLPLSSALSSLVFVSFFHAVLFCESEAVLFVVVDE